MEDLARKIDVEKLISYSDDLVEVLKNKKDINNLTQCLDEAQILQSSSQADSTEVQNFLEAENQKMINSCKQKIDETKSELVADANLDSLQRELEDELQRERLLQEELRYVFNRCHFIEEVRDLELQRVSIEVRKKIRKNLENDELRAHTLDTQVIQFHVVEYVQFRVIANRNDQHKTVLTHI
ncbi:hypothetical protein HHK36_032384 [Tetracentron sinense]|uniref:Uncharacterized protein n=1 Tax=Tetracentron sinense TaxID=13715 RepID=A0A835CWR2_TETSI|nr:hypothetical protein HHK36_033330 [Tetracentron sinense]KAF8369601.1 hypothetical protein HHK36_032384 [Tetracentron sinense]